MSGKWTSFVYPPITAKTTKYFRHYHENKSGFERYFSFFILCCHKIFSRNLFSLSITFFDLQRHLAIKNVYGKVCLPERTVHTEVFTRYCHGRKLSKHPVMCGQQLSGRQLPKELESVIVMYFINTRHIGLGHKKDLEPLAICQTCTNRHDSGAMIHSDHSGDLFVLSWADFANAVT